MVQEFLSSIYFAEAHYVLDSGLNFVDNLLESFLGTSLEVTNFSTFFSSCVLSFGFSEDIFYNLRIGVNSLEVFNSLLYLVDEFLRSVACFDSSLSVGDNLNQSFLLCSGNSFDK